MRPALDGTLNFSDEQVLAFVKKAYLRTALITSRGVWGYNQHYASASGAIWKAFGRDAHPGNADWQEGFAEGFEYTGTELVGALERIKVPRPTGSPDFNKGFETGLWVADQVFHHWPDSPNIHSKPEK